MVIMAIYIDNLTELVTVSVQCCDPGFSCRSCRWWCLWCWLVSGMQVWCAGGVVRRWCGVVWCGVNVCVAAYVRSPPTSELAL